MRPLLMGAETEYSLVARSGVQPMSPELVHDLLLEEIRGKHKWLMDLHSSLGLYLENGSRCYLDSGAHNELCTPELASPRQVACYDRANDKILAEARVDAMSRQTDLDIRIIKNNLDVSRPNDFSWGQHEAFTCWISLQHAARQLIPHLVSRLPYAGAGSLSCHSNGMGFELSQRARHITRATGVETTHDRAIFCTRAWKSQDSSDNGWTRTNLISKDSQRCSFGMYLCFGVTGLLFSIVNEGHTIGRDAVLKDPVKAMRQISLDPWLEARVQMADGRRLTAIEIQRLYRDKAERLVAKGDFPDWAPEVLAHWSATLDQLEKDPMELANRLDPYMKLAIFEHELARSEFDWKQLRQALRILHSWRRCFPEETMRAILSENDHHLTPEQRASRRGAIELRAVRRVGLDAIRFAVRLQALELNYHELGGLFDRLDTAGHVDHLVVAEEDVERAKHQAPPGSRAELRGSRIRDLSGNSAWRCEWQAIVNQADGSWYDMRDPFSPTCELTPAMGEARLEEILAELM